MPMVHDPQTRSSDTPPLRPPPPGCAPRRNSGSPLHIYDTVVPLQRSSSSSPSLSVDSVERTEREQGGRRRQVERGRQRRQRGSDSRRGNNARSRRARPEITFLSAQPMSDHPAFADGNKGGFVPPEAPPSYEQAMRTPLPLNPTYTDPTVPDHISEIRRIFPQRQIVNSSALAVPSYSASVTSQAPLTVTSSASIVASPSGPAYCTATGGGQTTSAETFVISSSATSRSNPLPTRQRNVNHSNNRTERNTPSGNSEPASSYSLQDPHPDSCVPPSTLSPGSPPRPRKPALPSKRPVLNPKPRTSVTSTTSSRQDLDVNTNSNKEIGANSTEGASGDAKSSVSSNFNQPSSFYTGNTVSAIEQNMSSGATNNDIMMLYDTPMGAPSNLPTPLLPSSTRQQLNMVPPSDSRGRNMLWSQPQEGSMNNASLSSSVMGQNTASINASKSIQPSDPYAALRIQNTGPHPTHVAPPSAETRPLDLPKGQNVGSPSTMQSSVAMQPASMRTVGPSTGLVHPLASMPAAAPPGHNVGLMSPLTSQNAQGSSAPSGFMLQPTPVVPSSSNRPMPHQSQGTGGALFSPQSSAPIFHSQVSGHQSNVGTAPSMNPQMFLVPQSTTPILHPQALHHPKPDAGAVPQVTKAVMSQRSPTSSPQSNAPLLHPQVLSHQGVGAVSQPTAMTSQGKMGPMHPMTPGTPSLMPQLSRPTLQPQAVGQQSGGTVVSATPQLDVFGSSSSMPLMAQNQMVTQNSGMSNAAVLQPTQAPPRNLDIPLEAVHLGPPGGSLSPNPPQSSVFNGQRKTTTSQSPSLLPSGGNAGRKLPPPPRPSCGPNRTPSAKSPLSKPPGPGLLTSANQVSMNEPSVSVKSTLGGSNNSPSLLGAPLLPSSVNTKPAGGSKPLETMDLFSMEPTQAMAPTPLPRKVTDPPSPNLGKVPNLRDSGPNPKIEPVYAAVAKKRAGNSNAREGASSLPVKADQKEGSTPSSGGMFLLDMVEPSRNEMISAEIGSEPPPPLPTSRPPLEDFEDLLTPEDMSKAMAEREERNRQNPNLDDLLGFGSLGSPQSGEEHPYELEEPGPASGGLPHVKQTSAHHVFPTPRSKKNIRRASDNSGGKDSPLIPPPLPKSTPKMSEGGTVIYTKPEEAGHSPEATLMMQKKPDNSQKLSKKLRRQSMKIKNSFFRSNKASENSSKPPSEPKSGEAHNSTPQSEPLLLMDIQPKVLPPKPPRPTGPPPARPSSMPHKGASATVSVQPLVSPIAPTQNVGKIQQAPKPKPSKPPPPKNVPARAAPPRPPPKSNTNQNNGTVPLIATNLAVPTPKPRSNSKPSPPAQREPKPVLKAIPPSRPAPLRPHVKPSRPPPAVPPTKKNSGPSVSPAPRTAANRPQLAPKPALGVATDQQNLHRSFPDAAVKQQRLNLQVTGLDQPPGGAIEQQRLNLQVTADQPSGGAIERQRPILQTSGPNLPPGGAVFSPPKAAHTKERFEDMDGSEVDSSVTVTAIYDFTGSTDDDLTFKTGDKVSKVTVVDDGWYKGWLNGKSGIFPKGYVTLDSEQNNLDPDLGPAYPTWDDDPVGLDAEAPDSTPTGESPEPPTLDNSARSDTPSSDNFFDAKDQFEYDVATEAVADSDPSAEHTESLDTAQTEADVSMTTVTIPRTSVALFAFTGQDDSELTFVEGQMISITGVVNEEWLTGEVDGKQGIFPAAYVKEQDAVEDESAENSGE